MTTDKSSEREAFVYWWRHKYSAADLEGIPEHVALNAAWAAWQARAALPQQAQDIAEASGGAEGGPEEDRIEAAFWRFDARHKGYGQWRQAPMSERDAFKAEMRNALHAEAVRAEMRMVVKGWRKQGPQQAQEAQAWLDVLAERKRQVEAEGWTAEHDDEHDSGEMAGAASAYALAAADRLHPMSQGDGEFDKLPPAMWPWDYEWWKPGEPRRMLVKAGALILAEIERLDRAAIAKGEQSHG